MNIFENEQLDKLEEFLKLRQVVHELYKRFLKLFFNEDKKFIEKSMIFCYRANGISQRISNKLVRVGYKILVMAETYDYDV